MVRCTLHMSLSVAGRVRRTLENHERSLIWSSACRDLLPAWSLFVPNRRRTAHVRVQVMNAIVKCGLSYRRLYFVWLGRKNFDGDTTSVLRDAERH